MIRLPRVRLPWSLRQRTLLVVLIPLFATVIGSSSRALPAAQGFPTSTAAARQTVRDRLDRAAAGSRRLFDRAARANRHIANLALSHVIREDEPGMRRGRFSPVRDVREYWRLRPWETAYRWIGSAPVPMVATEDWPAVSDAPALRELLNDENPSVRGLAVEALGALGLPEDIRRIGSLLTDTTIAVPALARTWQRSSIGGYIRPGDDDALVPLVWSDRTVGAYARAAVLLMTGRRFDGTETVSFAEWIDLHDLGEESLWYWQRRLSRERHAVPGFVYPSPAEEAAYLAELRTRLSDFDRLSAEAQTKVFLLTETSGDESWIGPVNPYFPDFTLRIGRERILELLDGRNIWRDCLDNPGVKRSLMWRIARLAPAVLPARDWRHVREVLQTRAPTNPRTPVVMSRLLPAAVPGHANDPQTREGFLRATLARSTSDQRLQLVAAEMVRTNLAVQWSFLAARFSADPEVGRNERLGILDALREQPRSREKLAALVAFLDDPRNGPLLTLPRREATFDLARQSAFWTLVEYAGGTPSVPMKLFDDLPHPDRSSDALMELRRVGHAVLDRWNAEKGAGVGPDARAIAVLPPLTDDGRRDVVADNARRSSQSQTAAQSESAFRMEARQAVRDRLERAVAGSRELFDRAQSTDSAVFGERLDAVIPEDRPALRRGRFSPLADVREYWRLRPWETAYGWDHTASVPLVGTEGWPTRGDATALRDLVSDLDPAIRGLAVEALGVLGLPEDIPRIGTLLTDSAPAAPALARIAQRGGTWSTTPPVEQALVPMVWSDRTVGGYARAALRLMIGDSYAYLNFPEWIDGHDLGWESLRYWERRLVREQVAVAAIEPSPGEGTFDFSRRRMEATKQYRAELRKQFASDLNRLSAEAQAKIHLLTGAGVQWDSVTGPINTWFPDGFALHIGRERILELLDGHNIWRDGVESDAENVLLWRLGRLAPTLLPERDWPHVLDQLQTRAALQPGMPVLVSRLLPPAGIGQADGPRTREGFLRASLARAVSEQRLQLIAAEMVRTNVQVQWAFLAARFNPDPAVGRSERLGVLSALAEAPHSREKLVALVAFVDDPRNAPLLTQRRENMAELPRQRAMDALNAFSGTPGYAPYQLQQDLGSESRQAAALIELRRLAHELLAKTRDAIR